MPHTGREEQSGVILSRVHTARKRLIDHFVVIVDGIRCHNECVHQSMINEHLAPSIDQIARQIRVIGIGDGFHQITLAGEEVVDIPVNPMKFRYDALGICLIGDVTDIRHCNSRVFFVKQVVHVIASDTHEL